MTDPAAARAFLISEVGALEPFGFLAVVPAGQPLQAVEITQREEGALEVRVPGRPRGIPELPVEVRQVLRDQGFAAADPADQTEPWVCEASDPEAAVALLQSILVDAFGAKPDTPLDLGHGSHRAEHEAGQKLEIARSRIATVVADILGREAEQDEDGDYVLPIDEVHVKVTPRVIPDGQIVVRVVAITNVGITVTPELGIFLARLNFGLTFGRFALDVEHQAIWFDEALLGEEFREEELRFAVKMVATTADAWDDRLKQMFGGSTFQEVQTGRAEGAGALTKPGEGTGLYL